MTEVSKPHSSYDLETALRLARWYDEHNIPRGHADEALVNMARALIGSVEQYEALHAAARAYRDAEAECDRTGEWEPAREAAVVLDELLTSNPAKSSSGIQRQTSWGERYIDDEGRPDCEWGYTGDERDNCACPVCDPASDPFDAGPGGQVTHVHDPASSPKEGT